MVQTFYNFVPMRFYISGDGEQVKQTQSGIKYSR